MANSAHPADHRFHETPLVLFSTLGIAGAGIGAATLVRAFLSSSLPVVSRSEALLLSLLLGVGTLISAGHLGRPLRGPLALRRLGKSPLSNEILAVGIALLGAGLCVGLPADFALRWIASVLACLGSLGFLLALGAVYDIPGQLAWRGSAVFQPLALATAWGLLLGFDRSFSPEVAGGVSVFLVVLLLDGVLVVGRNALTNRGRRLGVPVHPGVFRWRGILLATRLVSSGVAAALTILGDLDGAALLALSLALLVDRFGFYGLAIRWTSESEVARVEALL